MPDPEFASLERALTLRVVEITRTGSSGSAALTLERRNSGKTPAKACLGPGRTVFYRTGASGGARMDSVNPPGCMRMREATARDLAGDVLAGSPLADGAAVARRVEALTTLVFDLLAEVEALRQAVATQPAYRDAYRDACLLTHNSAGPSSGWEKLLGRYYPRQPSTDGRAWRETLMMRRLGFTPAEVEAYQREAEQAETYT